LNLTKKEQFRDRPKKQTNSGYFPLTLLEQIGRGCQKQTMIKNKLVLSLWEG